MDLVDRLIQDYSARGPLVAEDVIDSDGVTVQNYVIDETERNLDWQLFVDMLRELADGVITRDQIAARVAWTADQKTQGEAIADRVEGTVASSWGATTGERADFLARILRLGNKRSNAGYSKAVVMARLGL